ncbi:MAG: thiol protease/hemagglutinin PrtT [Muribaculaceae bacterium]|nr:thiol protease/hemagglutinin PrtT [Muribaculaceae bacterium]
MKFRFLPIVVSLILLSIPTMYSKTISLDQAESIAKKWKSSSALGTRTDVSDNSPVLAYELADDTTEEAALWVFNYVGDNGFVIVAADDMAASPVLGYSDEGAFNKDDMPENFKYWLEEYARQIEFIRNHPEVAGENTRAFGKSVQPLVQSKWAQNSPFNLLCPKINGQPSGTGCVATTMAQLMYFHRTPQGPCEGDISYHWVYGDTTLSEDFSKVTFDWDNMTPTYTNNSTEMQKLAVAKLMQVAGYSCEMNYTPSGSSSGNIKSIPALIKYFGFSKGIQQELRDFVSTDEFEREMVEELDAGRPIYMSGGRYTGSGHVFICDGYNADGYFHINWGWGGASDGYFLTTALGPNAQSVGGYLSAYVYNEWIYTNIKPRGDVDEDYQFNLVSFGALSSPTESVEVGSTTMHSISGIGHYGIVDAAIMPGIGIFDEKDEMISVTRCYYCVIKPNTLYSMSYLTLDIPKDIADGTYYVRLVYQLYDTPEFDKWEKVKIIRNNSQYVIMEVRDGKAFFSMPTLSNLSATNFKMLSSIAKKSYAISVDVKNTGMTEYRDEMKLIISEMKETEQPGEYLAESDIIIAGVEPGQSQTLTFIGSAPSRGGKLMVSAVDSKGNVIGSQNLEFDKGAANITAVKNSVINNPDTKTVQYTCYLANSGGDFSGKIYLRFYIYQNGSMTLLNTYEKEITLVDKDGAVEFSFVFEPDNPIPGASYTCILILDDNGKLAEITQNRTRKTFTMTNVAVGNITADNSCTVSGISGGIEISADKALEVRAYSTSGALVAVSPIGEGVSVIDLPAGFYIVRTDSGHTFKVVVK